MSLSWQSVLLNQAAPYDNPFAPNQLSACGTSFYGDHAVSVAPGKVSDGGTVYTLDGQVWLEAASLAIPALPWVGIGGALASSPPLPKSGSGLSSIVSSGSGNGFTIFALPFDNAGDAQAVLSNTGFFSIAAVRIAVGRIVEMVDLRQWPH